MRGRRHGSRLGPLRLFRPDGQMAESECLRQHCPLCDRGRGKVLAASVSSSVFVPQCVCVSCRIAQNATREWQRQEARPRPGAAQHTRPCLGRFWGHVMSVPHELSVCVFLPDCTECARGSVSQPQQRAGGRTPPQPQALALGPVGDAKVKRSLQQDLEEDSGEEGTDYLAELHSVTQPLPQQVNYTPFVDLGLLSGPWHFWEIWAGEAQLSRVVSEIGLAVMPSVDILPVAHNGMRRLVLDLLTGPDTCRLWQLLQHARPAWVHVAPPCTYWSSMSRLTAHRTQREWCARAADARTHLRLAQQVVMWQSQQGLYASIEQPPGCVSWRKRRLQALGSLPNWNEVTFASCAYGHRDPGSGKLYRKFQKFGANVDISSLSRRCRCKTSHEVCQGHVVGGAQHGQARTSVAGAYPQAMCESLAAIISDVVGMATGRAV